MSFTLIGISVIVVAYFVVLEIFTVLFRLTGLTAEKARFQVVSLMTNSGFTTKESEIITEYSPRRKLALLVMLFGYLFTLTAVSLGVNLLLRVQNEEFSLLALFGAVIILVVFSLLTRSKEVIKLFDAAVEKVAGGFSKNANINVMRVLDSMSGRLIAEIIANNLGENEGKTIKELDCRAKYGINLLVIKRKDKVLDPIDPQDILKKGDRILVFGKEENINKMFSLRK